MGASRTTRAPNQWEHRERHGPMSGKTVGVVLTRFRNKVDAKHMINVWNGVMDTRKGTRREKVLVAARFSGSKRKTGNYLKNANEMRQSSLRQPGRTRQAGRPDTETKQEEILSCERSSRNGRSVGSNLDQCFSNRGADSDSSKRFAGQSLRD